MSFAPAQVSAPFKKSKFLATPKTRDSLSGDEDVDDEPDISRFTVGNDPDKLLEIYAAGSSHESDEERELREAVRAISRSFLAANRGKNLPFLTENGTLYEVPVEKFCLLATDGHPRPWACIATHAFDWATRRAALMTRNAEDEYAALGLAPLLAKYNEKTPVVKPTPKQSPLERFQKAV
eukprot:CAMPEP_0118941408 /NCGR_PEP_ID=MMETSP1169-20130426/33782_1 /TAXON_ID=36882 /ORGANISM="Pyramimonas obovata, Strain CCMP722" /LENGTH=179 /DNA_ID=CAMNT_0006886143 /DNA_START=420 /DNA_END=956 /DNA_ORIENTATION=+